MKEAAKVHLALAVSTAFFGAFPVVGKIALAELGPFALGALRVGAAAVLLQALRHVTTGERIFARGEVRLFLASAALGVVLNQGLFLFGLSRTTAIHSVLLVSTIPAFTYSIGVLARREALSGWKAGGIALAFAGVAILLGARGEAGGRAVPQASVLGDALVTANCACYAVYLVISKPLTRRYDPLTVVAWVFTFGAVAFVPIGAVALSHTDWTGVTWRAWAALAWIVIFPTSAAYYLSSWALRRAEASLVAAYVFLQPVVTAALAIPWLGERPGWPALVAASAIFGGVTLIARGGRARPAG